MFGYYYLLMVLGHRASPKTGFFIRVKLGFAIGITVI